MITTKLYLDNRYAKRGQPGSLKLCIVKNGKSAMIPLGIPVMPEQWDKAAQKIKNHPNKMSLNSFVRNRCTVAENVILRLVESGEVQGMGITEVKRRIESALNPDAGSARGVFEREFLKFADSKKESTKACYMHTYGRLKAFCGNLSELRFENINKDWLTRFDAWLDREGSHSKNARNIHLRNIRAVFNAALDDEVTAAYPFRRFKIRPEATAKRSLPVERLRELWSWPVEEVRREYLDVFKLVFLLIGINMVDLCGLTEVRDGRVEYRRAKTGRLYSIKVEPEAMELIGKHRGEGHLLDILDRWKSHKDYLHRLNENLRKVGRVTVGKRGKKDFEPLCPGLTTYWARHSWATIAASLDIPKETIAHALGHGGNTVTDIYIDFDRRKVDEANRRVIDWVLYGKR